MCDFDYERVWITNEALFTVDHFLKTMYKNMQCTFNQTLNNNNNKNKQQ